MIGQKTLLVVDDEPLLRLGIQAMLEDGGYAVETASDGDAAIAFLEGDCAISGLVTDIRLGAGPTGWEVARRARMLNPIVSVVYITADSAADWPAEGVPKSTLLQKPFADAQLLTAISVLLNEQSNSIQSQSG